MKKNKIIKLQKILILLFVAATLKAQPVETFVEMAKAYNPELKAMKTDYESALQKVDQVNQWPDPGVSFAAGVLPVETRLGSQLFKLGVSQMIPWKGSLNAKEDFARAMAEEKAFLDELGEINIEYAIQRAYSMLQFLESQKGVIESRLEVLDAMEEMAKSAVRTGKGSLSDVLLIERKREELNANKALLDKKQVQSTIIINRWSGRALDDSIIINDDLDEEVSASEVYEFARQGHPQFQILQNRINASNAAINLIQYESKPTIGVGLDYSWIAKRRDVEMPNNGRDVLMPMVNVSLPLNTKKYEARRKEEVLKQEAIQSQVLEFQDRFTSEIAVAFQEIEYQDQVIEKYESLRKITKETLELMRREYAAEGKRFEELLRLEMEMLDYDQQILLAKYEKQVAIAILKKYN